MTLTQVEPCFLDWVDELSQVASTMRAGKAIGVDADWRARTTGASLRELRNKRSVAINFLMCGKVASCVVSQECQDSP